MTTPIHIWLAAADALLADEHADEERVDELFSDGIAADAGESARSVDPVQMTRVLAVLRARRAALAAEIADLARRRVELSRAQAGVTGYLNAGERVPMH